MFLQFDWRVVDGINTEATVAADVSGEGSNDFGKFDVTGELLVFDTVDAAELEGWRQYGTVKTSDDRMYKLKCTKKKVSTTHQSDIDRRRHEVTVSL